MTTGKREPPLRLDMSFEEALKRFSGTDPREIEESVERSKQKKPPEGDAPRRQVGSSASKSPTRKR